MANKKISDGALVASVVGTTEFEISNGTATQLKCNSGHIGDYAVTTQTHSSLATTNKEVDSAINEVNSDLGAHETISNPHTGSSPSFASITSTIEVITNKIIERTVGDGIEINVGGNSGAFYDYPTPPNTWFVFSGSGSPDDGTNIYLPYDSSDGTWFGYGMGAIDVVHFGSVGDETTMTGDGQFKSNKLTLGSTQQVDTISSDITFTTALDTELATKAAIKSYINAQVGASTLNFSGDSGVGAIDLDSQIFGLSGTVNQIITSAASQVITFSLPQNIHSGASPTFVTETLSALTASRLIASDGSNTLESVATLSSWITSTGASIAITDGGNGKVNLETAGEVIWQRISTSISVLNSDDTLDFSTAGVIIESVSSIQDIVAATGLSAVSDINMRIQSSTTGDSIVTANPPIVAGSLGQILTLFGADNIKTVTFTDGNGIKLDTGQSITLGLDDNISFKYINTNWVEISRIIVS